MVQAAIKQAIKEAKHKFAFHGVIVVKGGAIVATGSNHDDRHAEVVALSKLWPSKRKGTTVISVRVRKTGTVGMAKPCQACEQFLRDNGVKKVVYSDACGQMHTMKL